MILLCLTIFAFLSCCVDCKQQTTSVDEIAVSEIDVRGDILHIEHNGWLNNSDYEWQLHFTNGAKLNHDQIGFSSVATLHPSEYEIVFVIPPWQYQTMRLNWELVQIPKEAHGQIHKYSHDLSTAILTKHCQSTESPILFVMVLSLRYSVSNSTAFVTLETSSGEDTFQVDQAFDAQRTAKYSITSSENPGLDLILPFTHAGSGNTEVPKVAVSIDGSYTLQIIPEYLWSAKCEQCYDTQTLSSGWDGVCTLSPRQDAISLTNDQVETLNSGISQFVASITYSNEGSNERMQWTNLSLNDMNNVLKESPTTVCFGSNNQDTSIGIRDSRTYFPRSLLEHSAIDTNLIQQLLHPLGVSSSRSVSCAWYNNGYSICWSNPNANAYFTDGVNKLARRPRVEFYQISVGGYSACGIDYQQKVRCWGSNMNSKLLVANDIQQLQCSTSNFRNTNDLQQVHYLSSAALQCTDSSDVRFKDIAVGNQHTCAVTQHGSVSCWGRQDEGQLGPCEKNNTTCISFAGPVVSVGVGNQHSCALWKTGNVTCWGSDLDGRLNVPYSQYPYRELTVGEHHSCALESVTGLAKCWGKNELGEVSSTPPDVQFDAISAGSQHTCGITSTEQSGNLLREEILQGKQLVMCWGSLKLGECTKANSGCISKKLLQVRPTDTESDTVFVILHNNYTLSVTSTECTSEPWWVPRLNWTQLVQYTPQANIGCSNCIKFTAMLNQECVCDSNWVDGRFLGSQYISCGETSKLILRGIEGVGFVELFCSNFFRSSFKATNSKSMELGANSVFFLILFVFAISVMTYGAPEEIPTRLMNENDMDS